MSTTTAQQNGLLDAATRYASLGYPVFPCRPGDKRPLTEHGLKDATFDKGQIETWWSHHPNANIGLPTHGLIVIDVDGEHNRWLADDPDKAYELSKAGALAVTPRGGKHYVFRQPEGKHYRNTAGKLADYVDTRADGGYIVVDPSIVDGKPYTWQDGMELTVPRDKLPEPPTWLVEQLDALTNGQTKNSKPTATPGESIGSGQRNSTLTSLAGKMRRAGMGEAAILAALQKTNADRCKPPLPDSEVQTIAKSVGRYEPGELPGGDKPKVEYPIITCAELVDQQFDITFLVDRVLVAGQPCILAGPKKAMKTSTLIDLGISLAMGGFFLGKFRVSEAVTVAIMTGESGLATVGEVRRSRHPMDEAALRD